MKLFAWLKHAGKIHLPPSSVGHIDVLHDDGCGTEKAKRCNCRPSIRHGGRLWTWEECQAASPP
jgi:hypothetical protein